MMMDYVGLALPLLGILCGLLALLAGKHQTKIKSLEHDVFVLSNITGRNDIYKQIVFEPRQSSDETGDKNE